MRIAAVICVVTAGCTPWEQEKVSAACSVPLAQYRNIWFTDSGDRLVAEGAFGAAIWETASWKPIQPCPLRYPESAQAVSADARSIAVRTLSKTVDVGPIGGPFTTVIRHE
jgi:hypothetical protein